MFPKMEGNENLKCCCGTDLRDIASRSGGNDPGVKYIGEIFVID